MARIRYIAIANPAGKRWGTYHQELLAFWAARGEVPEVTVVPWADVVRRDGDLDAFPAFDTPAVVRLESPGKDSAVARLLLEAADRDDPRRRPTDWQNMVFPKGLLVRPGHMHRGFVRVLRGLRTSFDRRPHLKPTACPSAVAAMFDKNGTLARLAAAGVPVPEWVPPTDLPTGPSTFLDNMLTRTWSTTYVKLNTGSSATGIIVVLPDGTAVSTLLQRGTEFFNTRRLQHHTTADTLHGPLGFLLTEGVTVQRGIPLSQIEGVNFDLRVVCVCGRPVAVIVRTSPNPMTNLHLGGRRGEVAAVRKVIPPRCWLDALDAASDAAECFETTMAGVDVVFDRQTGRPSVLEVNAFGDFFPGWTDAEGWSVHRHEIAATAARAGW